MRSSILTKIFPIFSLPFLAVSSSYALDPTCNPADLRRKADALLRAYNCENSSSQKECMLHLGLLPGSAGAAALLAKMEKRTGELRPIPVCTVQNQNWPSAPWMLFLEQPAYATSCLRGSYFVDLSVKESLADLAKEKAEIAKLKRTLPHLKSVAAVEESYGSLSGKYKELVRSHIAEANEYAAASAELESAKVGSENYQKATARHDKAVEKFGSAERQWKELLDKLENSSSSEDRAAAQKARAPKVTGLKKTITGQAKVETSLWEKLLTTDPKVPKLSEFDAIEERLASHEASVLRNEQLIADFKKAYPHGTPPVEKGIELLEKLDYYNPATQNGARHAADTVESAAEEAISGTQSKGRATRAILGRAVSPLEKASFKIGAKGLTKLAVGAAAGPIGFALAVAAEAADIRGTGQCSDVLISQYVQINVETCRPQLSMDRNARNLLELDDKEFAAAAKIPINCNFINDMHKAILPKMTAECGPNGSILAQRSDGLNFSIATQADGTLSSVEVDRRDVPVGAGRDHFIPPKRFVFNESGEVEKVEPLSFNPSYRSLGKFQSRNGNRIPRASGNWPFIQVQVSEVASCCFSKDSRPSDTDCANYGIKTAKGSYTPAKAKSGTDI